MHLAVGDSLLHGKTWGARELKQMELGGDGLAHVYRSEDPAGINDVLGRRYHVVVGNPPYVTVKDATLNAEYRRYGSCHRTYSLAVPFTERFFDLATPFEEGSGYVGMITANSFMKREFGTKLVKDYVPHWDLTHVIDTSGAHIPNHDTPTVILFGRNRLPVDDKVRMVMGIRGEPSPPADPANGLAWTEIVRLLDRVDTTGEFVSVSDVERERLRNHPWSIGGGGAAELKEALDNVAGVKELRDLAYAIGRTTVVGEDDAWILEAEIVARQRIAHRVVDLVIGEHVRDWSFGLLPKVIYPYESLGGTALRALDIALHGRLWPFRRLLRTRTVFNKTVESRGQYWYEHLEHYTDKLRTSFALSFAFIATHNHFVLSRGGRVFNRSAPVIKLADSAVENDFLGLAGMLNTSTA
jgi:hypothetical protein